MGIYAKGVLDDAIADYHDKDGGQCLNQQLKIIMKITVQENEDAIFVVGDELQCGSSA